MPKGWLGFLKVRTSLPSAAGVALQCGTTPFWPKRANCMSYCQQSQVLLVEDICSVLAERCQAAFLYALRLLDFTQHLIEMCSLKYLCKKPSFVNLLLFFSQHPEFLLTKGFLQLRTHRPVCSRMSMKGN